MKLLKNIIALILVSAISLWTIETFFKESNRLNKIDVDIERTKAKMEVVDRLIEKGHLSAAQSEIELMRETLKDSISLIFLEILQDQHDEKIELTYSDDTK